MNTDRTFDPAQQGDMNATRRINVGPSTVRPAAVLLRYDPLRLPYGLLP